MATSQTADFPTSVHTEINSTTFANAGTALGSSTPTLSEAVEKMSKEINATQDKIGTGSSNASSATANYVIKSNGSGGSAWGQVAHSELSGLASGDGHTQYALLAGRSGGQTLYGSQTASQNLILQANSVNNTTGRVVFDSPTQTLDQTTTFTDSALALHQTTSNISLTGSTQAFGFYLSQATISFTNSSNVALGAVIGNWFTNTVKNVSGNNITLGQISASIATPTIQADNGTVTIDATSDFISRDTLDGINGGTLNITTYTGFNSSAVINDGCTVTQRRGLYVLNAELGGGGAITNQYGIYLDQLGAGTNNYSIYSDGNNAVMQHAGQAVFGAASAPTNSSVGLEVQSTTRAFLASRMTNTQRNALTAVNGMIIYSTTDNQLQGYVNGSWTSLT